MAIENSITFGGVNSADFGIYISGEGVFNAPKRDVDMVTIPGRNGQLALDKGRFENIEVTYPAFNFEPNDYDTFAQRLSDFRNAICAQRGYQRLEDTFHPDEYRMATYIDGLDIKPIKYNTASEFDITFNCKPQRWLKAGEEAVTVASGDTLTNPTLFETGPLMEVEGYGGIIINGEEVSLESTTLGNILISNGDGWRANNVPATQTVQPGLELLNNGDAFSIESVFAEFSVQYKMYGVESASLVDTFGPVSGSLVNSTGGTTIRIALDTQNFTKGTSVSDIIGNMNYHIEANGGTATASPVFGLTLQYSGNNSITIRARTTNLGSFKLRKVRFGFTTLIGNSSKSALGNPTYIDLNDGEVYGDISGITVDLNKIAVLPAELPVLGPGNNTITYDNTITELKVIPRWWKV